MDEISKQPKKTSTNIFSIFIIILSMLCHAGLATLVLFIPVYFFVPIRKFIKLSLVSSLVVALIVFLLMKGGLALVLGQL
jgi:uncharacterized membrane protein